MFIDNPAIGSATATTQTPADNSTKVATTAYVDAATSALTGGDGIAYSAGNISVDYNTTNLKITANQLNTIQDITPTSTVQFGKMQIGPTQTIAATQQLVLTGADSNFTTGPNTIAYTDADQYPVFQNRNYSHNDISINFDAYHNGVWRSAYSGSNFQIYKVGDQLKFNYGAGVSAGSSFVWANAGYINTSGVLNWGSISATTFTGALIGNAATATLASTVTTNANLTGDVTSVGNATTLATVNSNTGNWGSTTRIPIISVNAKGLITAASYSDTWSGFFGAVSGANLTNLTAANISAGTAGINISGNAATATSATSAATLTTTRALWGQNFDGSADVTGSLSLVGNITGGASSMTILAGTGNSRTLTLQTTTSGGVATTALTIGADQNITIAKRLFNTGIATFLERVQVSGTTAPTTSAGLELGFNGTNTILLSYNRNVSAYLAAEQDALTHTIKISGTTASTINSNGTTTLAHRIQITGNTIPTSGAGVEMGYNSGAGSAVILPIDRATNAYKLLRLNGSTHQIEILDVTAIAVSADGDVTKPLNTYFNAYKSANTTNITGDGTNYTVICDTEITDIGGCYNAATGVFTARKTGKHLFTFGAMLSNIGALHNLANVLLVTTAKTYPGNDFIPYPIASGGYIKPSHNSVLAQMTAGDTAYMVVAAAGSTKTVGVYGDATLWTAFSGMLVA